MMLLYAPKALFLCVFHVLSLSLYIYLNPVCVCVCGKICHTIQHSCDLQFLPPQESPATLLSNQRLMKFVTETCNQRLTQLLTAIIVICFHFSSCLHCATFS